MPFRLACFSDAMMLVTHWDGRVTVGDLARGYDAYRQHPEVDHVTKHLQDLRSVEDLAVFRDGLMMLADVVRQDSASRAIPCMTAFVVRDVRFLSELLNYAADLSRAPALTARVFDDLAVSLTWLGVSPDFDIVSI